MFWSHATNSKIAVQDIGEDSASRDRIDALVDLFYAAPPSTMSKRKRKKQHDLINAQQQAAAAAAAVNEEAPVSGAKIADLHKARGPKCRIVSMRDNEAAQRDRLERSNER